MAGFLNNEFKTTVADFVFMNVSNIDLEWVELFKKSPLLASGIISIKNGITEDIWRYCGPKEADDESMRPFREYLNLRLSDIDKAIDKLTTSAIFFLTLYGGDFVKDTVVANLLCLKLCEEKELDDKSLNLLSTCMDFFENGTFLPDGVSSLEELFYAFHKEMNLPEFYFCFFTILYALDYEGFRSVAKKVMDERCNGNTFTSDATKPTDSGGTPVDDENMRFDVIMSEVGAEKLRLISIIREITGLGLKEAKDLVEGTTKLIVKGIPKKEAETIKVKIEQAGAKIEIKRTIG